MKEPSDERVKSIFSQALDLPPHERPPYLERACGADTAVRHRVEQLLMAHEDAGSFLASPTQTLQGGLGVAAEPQFEPGSMLGTRYRIVGLAGRGGMSEVYRAEDLKLEQTVALKLLPEVIAQDEARLSRLYHEVRVARQVSHPNVCRVYDIGEADGRHFLSMEWIAGRDLSTTLREEELSSERTLLLALQISAGLAAAHDCGVLHRDLKPSNVMVDERGVARITDFGLAEVGAAVRGDRAREGTPRYMSPEQLAGGEVGASSDIFSLGLVLYELFTGTPLYSGDTLEAITQQRLAPLPLPSRLARDIDPVVERLILRCLETDPSRRPPSARELVDTLSGIGTFSEALGRAQRRADRIGAFRTEMADLRGAGLLRISDEEVLAIEAHHGRVLQGLVRDFDIDTTERGKQLSLGIRVVSFLGAFAFAASVYYFFYRIWNGISTPLQAGILIGAPILMLFLTSEIARRERQRHFTLIAGLVTFACFVVETKLLESTFDITPSPHMILAWGLFGVILAYGYRLRLLLVIGLILLYGFSAALLLHMAGGHWPRFLSRPEGLFAGGILVCLLALSTHRRQSASFGSTLRVLGVTFLVTPTILLGMSASLSYLSGAERQIEIAYQVLGFSMSAGAMWLGIARRWKETVYTGTFFFVMLLFLEFVNWWWAWMPKYLFFLIVALASVAVLIGLRRLRMALATTPREVEA